MTQVVNALIDRASQMPALADSFALCDLAAEFLEVEIVVMAVDHLPFQLPASGVLLSDRIFGILYRPSTNPFSVSLSILHELAHLLLGHRQQTSDEMLSGTLHYTGVEEQEADALAYRLMALLAFQPPEDADSISGRYAAILPRKPKALRLRLAPDRSIAESWKWHIKRDR